MALADEIRAVRDGTPKPPQDPPEYSDVYPDRAVERGLTVGALRDVLAHLPNDLPIVVGTVVEVVEGTVRPLRFVSEEALWNPQTNFVYEGTLRIHATDNSVQALALWGDAW